MPRWRFLTNHARSLLLIATDPAIRLRDIAARLGITERSAHSIVSDLAGSGYILKGKKGRRSRYEIQVDLPLGEGIGRHTIGETLDFLITADTASFGEAGEKSAVDV